MKRAGLLEKREALVPSKRDGQPSDIADVVVVFARDRSSYLNGEEVVVDAA